MSAIKLQSISFGNIPFRKLKNLEIPLAPRLTVIAGHNGSGKSTILGLIANASGLTESGHQSYFDRLFQANFQEIFSLSMDYDFFQKAAEKPSAEIKYLIDGETLVKRCNTSKRTLENGKTVLRVVPRNEPKIDFEVGDLQIGKDAKVPLPTIYLGLSRMIPTGEAEPDSIERSIDKKIHPDDAKYIRTIIGQIIETGDLINDEITHQRIKGTLKSSKHPAYAYDSCAVSLGQDSLSAIVTALASFKRLQRETKATYIGGLLVIDELDACFHPRTQIDIVKMLQKEARALSLQIVLTTHSLTVIEKIYKDQDDIDDPRGKGHDAVVYLMDPLRPYIKPGITLAEIQSDMFAELAAVPKKQKPTVKLYTEDDEALYVLKLILDIKTKRRIATETGFGVELISAKMGCTALLGLYSQDDYFKSVVIVIDADGDMTALRGKKHAKTVLRLPKDVKNDPVKQSPEAILYAFCKSLRSNPDEHADSWVRLKAKNVTSAIIKSQFLDWTGDISARVPAKEWFVARQDRFDRVQLYKLWLLEHQPQVAKFVDELIAAIKAVRKPT